MPMTKEEILAEALTLRPEERDQLADQLWRSVDPADRREIEKAWAEEAEDRLAAYRRGELTAKPHQEVLDRLEKRPRPQ
jgi:putative addiction module component (TIGR02574 family)